MATYTRLKEMPPDITWLRFRKIPGTAKYKDVLSDVVISGYRYQKLKKGGAPKPEYPLADGIFKGVLRDYRGEKGVGKRFTSDASALRSAEFRAIVDALNNEEDNSPTGRKAQALVMIGRRQPEWNWKVGETPKM